MGLGDTVTANPGENDETLAAGFAGFPALRFGFRGYVRGPLQEGVLVPRHRQRASNFAMRVINRVDVALGDRHPVRVAKDLGNQMLAGLGAIADSETGRRLAPASADSQAAAADSDLLEVPLGTYCENGDMSSIVAARQKGAVVPGATE